MTKEPVLGTMIGGIVNMDSGADILCRNDAKGFVMHPEACEALLVGGDKGTSFSGLPESWKSKSVYVEGYPEPIAPNWMALLSASIPVGVEEILMVDGQSVSLLAHEALAWTGLKRDLGTGEVYPKQCNELKGSGGVGQFKPGGDGWMPFKDKPSILWSAGVRPCDDADVRLYCLCPFDAN